MLKKTHLKQDLHFWQFTAAFVWSKGVKSWQHSDDGNKDDDVVDDDGDDDDEGTSAGYSCKPPKVIHRLHTKWLLWKSLSDGLSRFSQHNRLVELPFRKTFCASQSLNVHFSMPHSCIDFRSSVNVFLSVLTLQQCSPICFALWKRLHTLPSSCAAVCHTNADQTSPSVRVEQSCAARKQKPFVCLYISVKVARCAPLCTFHSAIRPAFRASAV